MNHKKLLLLIPGLILIMLLLVGCSETPAAPTPTQVLLPSTTPTTAPPIATPEPSPSTVTPLPTIVLPTLLEGWHWLGYEYFLFDGPPTIYFDPARISGGFPKADIILITHDHTSESDIVNIKGENTVVIGGPLAVVAVDHTLHVGEQITVKGVEIEAVPLYGGAYHPKEVGNTGFVITVDGKRFYYAGHTGFTDEMADIRCDVAFLPATYVDETAKMANTIMPKIVVLMISSVSNPPSLSKQYNALYEKVEEIRSLFGGEVYILPLDRE